MDNEKNENLTQAMLRWQELLEVLQARLVASEQTYQALLSSKEGQGWHTSEHLIDSSSVINRNELDHA